MNPSFLHTLRSFPSFLPKAIFIFLFCFGFFAEGVEAQGKRLRIAFGSCAHQDEPLPLWKTILNLDPQVWVWMGDAIYLDSNEPKEKIPAYQKQSMRPDYQLLQKKAEVWGTWDDHDYGTNDVGAEYAKKEESQAYFLDFLGVPTGDPLRKQAGLYHSREKILDGKRIRFLLLDMRYHRTQLKRNPLPFTKGYVSDTSPDSSFLGKEQWEWLQGEMQKPADLLVLVSSIQVLSEAHSYEKWGNFPLEKKRLLDLLDASPNPNIILVSGDRHIAEVFRTNTPRGKTIWEYTTSSLNRPLPWRTLQEDSPDRVSPVFSEPNFGLLEIQVQKNRLRWSFWIHSQNERLWEASNP